MVRFRLRAFVAETNRILCLPRDADCEIRKLWRAWLKNGNRQNTKAEWNAFVISLPKGRMRDIAMSFSRPVRIDPDNDRNTAFSCLHDLEYNLREEERRRVVYFLLNSIKERDSKIVCLRYGLADDNPMTFEDIGERMGLTKERVRQIVHLSIEKMRQIAEEKKMRDVLS